MASKELKERLRKAAEERTAEEAIMKEEGLKLFMFQPEIDKIYKFKSEGEHKYILYICIREPKIFPVCIGWTNDATDKCWIVELLYEHDPTNWGGVRFCDGLEKMATMSEILMLVWQKDLRNLKLIEE